MARKKIIVFGILLIVFVFLAVASKLLYAEKCENFDCFQEAMRKCEKAVFINDASEATWKYEIKRLVSSECVVEVELLQFKEGDLSFERLRGQNMECSYSKGLAVYPEKNLDKCHGRLKEELQTIIIKRLHTYLVNNLGSIEEGLDVFGA